MDLLQSQEQRKIFRIFFKLSIESQTLMLFNLNGFRFKEDKKNPFNGFHDAPEAYDLIFESKACM